MVIKVYGFEGKNYETVQSSYLDVGRLSGWEMM